MHTLSAKHRTGTRRCGADAGLSRRPVRRDARYLPRRARRPRSGSLRRGRVAPTHPRSHVLGQAPGGSAGRGGIPQPRQPRRSERNGSSRGAACAPSKRDGNRSASTKRRRKSGRRSGNRASQARGNRRRDRVAWTDYGLAELARLAVFGHLNRVIAAIRYADAQLIVCLRAVTQPTLSSASDGQTLLRECEAPVHVCPTWAVREIRQPDATHLGNVAAITLRTIPGRPPFFDVAFRAPFSREGESCACRFAS